MSGRVVIAVAFAFEMTSAARKKYALHMQANKVGNVPPECFQKLGPRGFRPDLRVARSGQL